MPCSSRAESSALSTPKCSSSSTHRRESEAPSGPGLSANAKILRDLIRARVQLQKLEARIFRRDYLPVLRRMERELLAAVRDLEAGKALNEVSAARIRALLVDVESIIRNAVGSLDDILAVGLANVAGREARLQHAALSRAIFGVTLNTVPAEHVAAVVNSTAEDLMRPFLKSWGSATLKKAKDEIAVAVGLGEDMDEAAARIAAAIGASKKSALAIARTGIQAAAAKAADAYHAENEDVLKGVQYVATLDARTCPVCGPDDGKLYTYAEDEGAAGRYEDKPEIPRHPNCRCTYSPVTKSWRELGVDIDDAPSVSTRASMDGEVPETLTWEEWFAERPTNQQRAILGPAVFDLWQSGKISLSDIAAGNSRRTLAQLLKIAGK